MRPATRCCYCPFGCSSSKRVAPRHCHRSLGQSFMGCPSQEDRHNLSRCPIPGDCAISRVELEVARESTSLELSCRAPGSGRSRRPTHQLSPPDASCHSLRPSFIQLSKLEATCHALLPSSIRQVQPDASCHSPLPPLIRLTRLEASCHSPLPPPTRPIVHGLPSQKDRYKQEPLPDSERLQEPIRS